MSQEWPLWEIFIRGQHGLNHRHVGSLHAPDAEMAINNARDVYTRRNEGVSIWAVRSDDIVASAPSKKGPLFEPANSKVYRHPTFFKIPEEVGHTVMTTAVQQASAQALREFLLRMGDSTLILGHRISEWCGLSPVLEEDIAMANVALDLIGQTQFWLGLAAEIDGEGKTADDLAYLRDAVDFRNLLLAEQPNDDYAHTLMRQFLFDAWHLLQLEALTESTDPRVAEIAGKAIKEVRYHLDRSGDMVIRLGDGTDESHRRMQDALDDLWSYTGEMFLGDDKDAEVAAAGIAPAPESLREAWMQTVRGVLSRATLELPESTYAHRGGKQGRHTEHLGYILADMQFLQRAYPGCTW